MAISRRRRWILAGSAAAVLLVLASLIILSGRWAFGAWESTTPRVGGS